MWPWIFQLLCSNTRICSNNLGPRPARKKKRIGDYVHYWCFIIGFIFVPADGMEARRRKSNEQSILFQNKLAGNAENGEEGPAIARSLRRSLTGLLSLCLLFLIRCLKNRCKASKSVSPPLLLCTTPLEVLIRAAVTRLIVASRGQLSHSWAAHFMAGSQSWNKWAQYAWLEKLRPSCCCRCMCLMQEADSLLLLLQIQNIALVLSK